MICRWHVFPAVLLVAVATLSAVPAQAQEDKLVDLLKIADTAADVEFQPLAGEKKIKLSELTKEGPVVLVVLRGWPGYQCPICSRQLSGLARHADEFAELGATVVFVYPGPADNLAQRAKEFLRDRELPQHFVYAMDPDYAFTNLYGLRWDAPRETAYPSTFVLDTNRVVTFRTISTSHRGRPPADDVLAAVRSLSAE